MTPNERAVEMLGFAAAYIRKHCPEESIFYDEAECDGYCVADDCESAAEELALPSAQAEAQTCETCISWGPHTKEDYDERICVGKGPTMTRRDFYCAAWAPRQAREGT